MASQLQSFTNEHFGTIRTITENQTVLFCGRDVATALGYANINDALARHCKGVVKHYPFKQLVVSSRSASSPRVICIG